MWDFDAYEIIREFGVVLDIDHYTMNGRGRQSVDQIIGAAVSRALEGIDSKFAPFIERSIKEKREVRPSNEERSKAWQREFNWVACPQVVQNLEGMITYGTLSRLMKDKDYEAMDCEEGNYLKKILALLAIL